MVQLFGRYFQRVRMPMGFSFLSDKSLEFNAQLIFVLPIDCKPHPPTHPHPIYCKMSFAGTFGIWLVYLSFSVA